MTEVMRRLAGHDLDVEIKGAERGDEIGRMAEAVRVFKDAEIVKQTAWRTIKQRRSAPRKSGPPGSTACCRGSRAGSGRWSAFWPRHPTDSRPRHAG